MARLKAIHPGTVPRDQIVCGTGRGNKLTAHLLCMFLSNMQNYGQPPRLARACWPAFFV